MADLYWDTSALVKHYHPELGTAEVDRLLGSKADDHITSRLTVTETFSVFAGKIRSGLITRADFDSLCRRFLADTKRRAFSVARLLVGHFRSAERLLQQYGPIPGQGIRTLDCIHLATAIDLRNRGKVSVVVSSDLRLTTVAKLEGFAVIDPEQV
jgi:predicted nucleic acid-binding protein